MFKRKESSLTTTIEFKLRVNQKFVVTCEMVLEACRTLYNCALEHRISRYRYTGQSINFYDQSAELTELRKVFPEMKAVLRQIQSDVLKRLQKAYNAFFERVKLKKQCLLRARSQSHKPNIVL